MTERSRRASAAAVCVLLAVIHTWPLALNPARHSRNDNGDALLNEWIMAWIAHQLPRDPLHLFEANIFYPAHDTLAFSEPLIVPALMGAPLAWAGASPVLVHNLVLIAGFALTAFAGWWLIYEWTGHWTAGLLTGSTFAFNTHTLSRLAHVQGVHLYGLILCLLAADRLVAGGRARDAWLLAFSMVLLAYTSGYLVVFASVMLGVVVLTRAGEWWHRVVPAMSRFAAAGVVAAVAIVPVYLPYRRVAREQHMMRSLDNVRQYSATLTGYIASAGRIDFATWSARFFDRPIDAFFPGFAAVALAIAAIVFAFRQPRLRPRVLMLVVLAAAGVVLSLGTATPIYGWLFHIFPPMQGLRAAARFGNLFILATAVLGGIGLAAWSPRTWIAVTLVVLANAESLRAPIGYRDFTGIPRIYRLLAEEPGRVVLVEQPFYPRQAAFENAPYVLNSTAHWRPLMNGYSGYTPASYNDYAGAFWYFPADWAIQAMKDAGVTHVMVHLSRFGPERGEEIIEKLRTRRDMELLAAGSGGIRLYRLIRSP